MNLKKKETKNDHRTVTGLKPVLEKIGLLWEETKIIS